MALIYAVFPLSGDPAALRKRIENVDPSFYDEYAPKIFFMRFNGPAKSLSNRLGFTSEDRDGSGFVLEVDDYFGHASKRLWDWLKPNE